MSDSEKVAQTEPEVLESKSEEEPVSDTAPESQEDDNEEKKEPASNGRKRKKPATPSAPRQGARKSARAAATVQHYNPTVSQPARSSGTKIVLGEGEGTELSKIPNVAKLIKKYKTDELKSVHQLLVGKPGKKLARKRAIGQFNGFSNDSEEAREALTAKLIKMTLKQLKFFCVLFDVEKPKDKDELVEGLVEFLYKPTPSGRKLKTTRALSPFFEFSRQEREGVKEKLGEDAGVAEVAKELGRMWGKLSAKQKESYRTADAPKPKKKAAKKKATKKKATKKKKKPVSSDEEESEEDDDEFREKLTRSICKIIDATEELTKRKVMDALKEEFEEDLVLANKQLIKEIIKEQTESA